MSTINWKSDRYRHLGSYVTLAELEKFLEDAKEAVVHGDWRNIHLDATSDHEGSYSSIVAFGERPESASESVKRITDEETRERYQRIQYENLKKLYEGKS